MRCPKCGYISFDHLESCKKCNKDISEVSERLDGTVFAYAAPLFLDLEQRHEQKRNDEVEEALDDEVSAEDFELLDEDVDGDEIVLDDTGLDEFEVLDDLNDEAITLDDAEEVILEDEVVLEDDEITLELGSDGREEVKAAGEEGLQLDFGEIDISDLAPPDSEEVADESLTLDDEPFVDAGLSGDSAPSRGSVAPGSGLEDLQVEGLDLRGPAPLVSGSNVGNKLMPSVKTGTALDDFEVDLGDLISDDK